MAAVTSTISDVIPAFWRDYEGHWSMFFVQEKEDELNLELGWSGSR